MISVTFYLQKGCIICESLKVTQEESYLYKEQGSWIGERERETTLENCENHFRCHVSRPTINS